MLAELYLRYSLAARRFETILYLLHRSGPKMLLRLYLKVARLGVPVVMTFGTK